MKKELNGVFGENWNVIYETESICAPKGSTVNMSCSYTYPQQYKLIDTFWIKRSDMKSLKEYPEYKDRVEYIEQRQNQTAVLRLHNITENDVSEYCFRLITNTEGQKWFGQPGIQLKVSGNPLHSFISVNNLISWSWLDRCVSPALQVKAPQLVLEKERVNLTCETTCSLTDGFIWYKNGQALKIQSETLQLQSERSDSGRYSCAVRGHQHLPSPAVNITVLYPPKSVSVSISASGEIVKGDSVTLSCSSDSNPPALNFSWFKENQTSAVGSGQSFIISSFNSSHSGRYYCEAQNQYGSQRSASVLVSLKDAWNILYIIGLFAIIAAGFGLLLLIIVVIIVHKRKKIKNNDSQDTDNHLNGSQDIEPKKTSAGNASESGDDDKILYASVPYHNKNKDTNKPEEDEIQYASVTVHKPATEAKSTAGQENDLSVIYSSIKIST
ncbi:B-cell receptor CD22-like [Onychostoma macrolepis]|uniref:B-cell receptor CD22-like n=1 Tax=Onychostoma macrolepis TaxID=369639 RepID=UPI00272C4FC8|nr:B-cell receptor CD22-like [Onychostoma macrolepis]